MSQGEEVPEETRASTSPVVDLTRAYALQDPAALAQAEQKVAAEWKPGDVILDLYEVKGVLGEGGMGKVYRVHHRGWAVDLAVKSPRPEVLASAGGKEDFVWEAEAWSGLGLHPHTVSCYYVRTLGGIPRVFAECVEGGSLGEWIRDRRLYEGGPEKALERILDIAIQFAWGLDYAHERGLVHQDVKPANVMMAPDGTAKVTDFGLARARGSVEGVSAVPGGTLLVSSGGMTPAYASPEQAAGEPLTRRTDLWSWAVSVLEMFTGEVTWTAGPAAGEALEAHLGTSQEDPVLPRMPETVAVLLRECFARDPEKRPKAMAEVARKLRDVYLQVCGQAYFRPEPRAAPDTAESLNNRACSMLDLGKGDYAEPLWEKALGLNPKHWECVFNRGLNRWRRGEIDDVTLLKDLSAHSDSSHGSWRAQHGMALVHLERDDLEGARTALKGLQGNEVDRAEVRSTCGVLELRASQGGGRRLLRLLRGHTGSVKTVCFSPDARHALSGSEDGTLRLWDLASGKCVRTFDGHMHQVNSVSLSADGRLVLSGGGEGGVAWYPQVPGGLVRLWEVATGRCVRTFEGHTGSVRAVFLTANGRIAMSTSCDTTLRVWETATGQCLRTFGVQVEPGIRHQTDDFGYADLSVDGRYALCGGGTSFVEPHPLRFWDLATGRCIRTFEGPITYYSSFCLSSDGRHALVGNYGGELHRHGGTIGLWEMATGRLIRTFRGHTSSVEHIFISADGRYALSSSYDKTLRLWEVSTGRCLRTFEGFAENVLCVGLSADGRYAMAGSDGKTLSLLVADATFSSPAPFVLSRIQTSGEAAMAQARHDDSIRNARVAIHCGKWPAAARFVRMARKERGFGRSIEALDALTGLSTHLPRGRLSDVWQATTLEGHTGRVLSVCLSADGHYALTGSLDNKVKLWELTKGRCIRTFEGHTDYVTSVQLSADGSRALSGGYDKTLRYWDVATGRCLWRHEGKNLDVKCACLSADGRYALSWDGSGGIRLWDVATGRSLRTFERSYYVNSLCFSADGQFALSGEDDWALRLWEVATGRCLRILTGLFGSTRVWGWDEGTRSRLRTFNGLFKGHTDGVNSVCLTADGRHALSGSSDHTIRFWDVPTGRRLRVLKGHTSRVNSVCMSADGRHALSVSSDRTIRIWEVGTGRCLWVLRVDSIDPEGEPSSISLSQDGRYALSGTGDNLARLWFLDWDLEEREAADWDDGASPFLEAFLSAHIPFGAGMPPSRTPTDEEIMLALTRRGKPTWNEEEFQALLSALGIAGYGWLKPEGVRRELERMVRHGVRHPLSRGSLLDSLWRFFRR